MGRRGRTTCHDADDVSHDGSRAGHDDPRSAAEERVRVLEQYIKDMSIQNMQRMQATNGSEKWEKEVTKKDEEIAKLKAVLVAQGNELTETKSDLEKVKREHQAIRDQLEIGCRRLAYHTTRYLTENAKWDLAASTSSTSTVCGISMGGHASTPSQNSVSSAETEDFPPTKQKPANEKAAAEEETPLRVRVEDPADYCSFPSKEALREDSHDFLRRLQADLRRLALPDSVKKGTEAFTLGQRTLSTESTGSTDSEQPTDHDHELWKAVEERLGRVEGEMRALHDKLGATKDLHLIDPVLVRQTTLASLTRMMHDTSHLAGPVREVLRQSRKVVSECNPLSRRLRLAESDLKNKEQRHALKVELLEKRLGRLTSTLTAVQQETRRSADDQHLSLSLLQGNLADQPEEFRQFLELVTERERDLRRAELQVSELQKLSETLERQLVDLALAKFDAERAVTQARSEEEYWSNKAKGQGDLMKTQAVSPAAAAYSYNQGLFENLFRHSAGQFDPAALQGEPSSSVLSTSSGLPPPPAFCAGGLPPFGMFLPPFGGLMPPSEETQCEA